MKMETMRMSIEIWDKFSRARLLVHCLFCATGALALPHSAGPVIRRPLGLELR